MRTSCCTDTRCRTVQTAVKQGQATMHKIKCTCPENLSDSNTDLRDTHPWQTQDHFLRRSTEIDDGLEGTNYSGQRRVWPSTHGVVMPHVIGHQKDLVCYFVELGWAVCLQVISAARWRRIGDTDCVVLAQPPKSLSSGLDQSSVRVVKGKGRRVGNLPIDRLKILSASMSAHLT